MEFKKTNHYSSGRSRLNVPQRGETAPVIPQPAPQPQATKAPVTPPKRRTRFSKKIITITVGVLLALIIGILAIVNAPTPTKTADGVVQKLDYATILPEGSSISQLGGWKRVSPPNEDPVFAYTDTVAKVSISVSQQPLPASFKGDVSNKVAELAKRFNATSTIDADGSKVYIGTSAKGPQSLIFTKNNLLILIKSQGKVEDKTWQAYINSLN